MAIRLGIVVAAHPEDHSVDLIMTDDHARLAGVQVLCSNGGQSSGTADMYVPDETSGAEKWVLAQRSQRDQIAVVEFSGIMPIVMGFIFPQIGQMTFSDRNRRVQRHTSDVYSTVDSAGNFELSFPNGTFARIGTSPNHEDLTGLDADAKWAITKNTSAATHLRVVLANAGAVKADLHIDTSGNVTGTFQGTGTLTFVGDLTVNAPDVIVNAATAATVNTATATINASTKVELATPLVHCTGVLTVDGALNVGGASTLHNVTSNGKNVGSTHTHGGVTTGSGHTAVVD